MVVPCSTNALYAITNFANALERYQRSAEDFFSPALLKILSDTFQWKNLGLTCYSGDQFLGCYGINLLDSSGVMPLPNTSPAAPVHCPLVGHQSFVPPS